MNKLLIQREPDYFENNPNDYYLFETVGNIMKIAKLFQYNKSYYFEYTGMQIKAITTASISFTDLYGTQVHYKGYPMIKGKIMSFGLTQSPYLYVFWTHTPMFDENGKILGMPCALPDVQNLELIF